MNHIRRLFTYALYTLVVLYSGQVIAFVVRGSIGRNRCLSTSPTELQVITQDAPSTAVELVKSIFVLSTQDIVHAFWVAFGVAFLLFLLSIPLVFFPAVIESIERSTKENYPDLYEEYQSKLLPGETLMKRPDLIQDLMDKVVVRMLNEMELEDEDSAPSNQQRADEDTGPRAKSSSR